MPNPHGSQTDCQDAARATLSVVIRPFGIRHCFVIGYFVIQYFPVRREADCGRSRGTDRRLVRESLGVRVSPQSLTTSATGELGTTVIRHFMVFTILMMCHQCVEMRRKVLNLLSLWRQAGISFLPLVKHAGWILVPPALSNVLKDGRLCGLGRLSRLLVHGLLR